MNWHLLDIRAGRANRAQFFCSIAVLGITFFLVYRIELLPLKIIGFVPLTYLLMTMMVRRLRDIEGKIPDFHYKGRIMNVDELYKQQQNLFPPNFLPMDIFLAFYEKTFPERNRYGEPPIGLNFSSMVTFNSTKEQETWQKENIKRTLYESPKRNDMNKATEIKPRGQNT